MSLKKIFVATWIPITIVMNAISLINLQKDILPAIIEWKGLINRITSYYQDFVEVMFSPIKYIFLNFFDIVLSSWVYHYILILLVLFSSLILTLNKINHKNTPVFKISFFLIFFWWIVIPILGLAIAVNKIINRRNLTKGEAIYFNYIGSLVFVLLTSIALNKYLL